MAIKMAAAYQLAFVATIPYSFFNNNCFQISYMDYFYQTLTQVGIWALSDNQDVRHNLRHLSVCTYGHLNIVIYNPISSKFYGLFSSNYWSCLNMSFVRLSIIKFVAKTDIPFQCRALCWALCRSPTVLVVFVYF